MKISYKGLLYEAQSSTNNLGRPISNTPEGISNFWKWFGNSITVDSSGNPIVLFHGTPEQVKSAVGNNGQYSSSSNSVTKE